MGKKKRKRRKSDACSSSSSKRPCYYLLQGQELLEQGTKRKMQDLEQSYKQLGMEVSVVDEQQYEAWKRRCTLKRQDEEYEQAKAADLEKQRLRQLQEHFRDPAKRREIIAKSYDLLFREKKYI